MARDGTYRGGRRPRAGERPEPLIDKVNKGKATEIMDIPDFPKSTILETNELYVDSDLFGEDMPDPSEYLSQKQRDGKPLGADEIFKETWMWLKERGCDKLINSRLLESYSQAFARFIQCEEAISEYGLLGKHPTTGGAIASPFVSMSQSFQKQANLLWFEIFDIVKQNSLTAFTGNPREDAMERLLRRNE
ncbi:P27 family phage terminase small subunit [Miniphocaeibacter massiliensis]|uniref:P27 family phage terminase small subunit n=1 Tax=Miniphocaeibacter massiliensis TaxID=2041841 RepID=UPI000C1BD772|nr:P27 family phage terminase small subunit [Miniphocaeibacter massiliensis]